jgi:hypothetical protein
VALVLVSSTLAGQARDTRTWYQAYRDAQTKIRNSNWQGAIDDLDAAARARAPRPGRNVNFYGDTYDTYNPDFYRGVALANLQRYAEADQAFERVRVAGLIVARDAQFAEFDRIAKDVKDNVARIARGNLPAGSDSKPPVTDTGLTADAGRGRGTAPDATAGGAGGGAVSDPSTATGTTTIAGSNANSTGGTVASDQAKQATQQPTSVASKQPITQTGRPRAAAATAYAGPADLGQVASKAASRIALEDERAGLVAHFSGNYVEAAKRLDNAAVFSSRNQRILLFLAASEAALVLTGQAPATTMTEARALFARVGDTTPLARDLALISPRILQELGLASSARTPATSR